MAYLTQFFIILLFSLLGEVCSALIPLPIPTSVWGLVLLLLALQLKVIRVEQVKKTANFLFDIMPVFFLAPVVGLMDTWPLLRSILLPVVAIGVLTTLITMAVTGWTAQALCRRKGGKGDA